MEVAMPMSGSAIDCYEDMFKEITRKLYGEEGLPELSTTDRHQVTQDRGLTPIDYDVDAPLLKPEEHITAFGLAALMQNGFPPASILNPQFQQHKPNPNFEDKWIISEDSLQWTQSKIASYNPAQKLFRCAECDCVGYLPRVAEHWLGTHSNMRVFQCPQCPYESAWARCVRMHLTRQHNINAEDTTDTLTKNNPVLQDVTRFLQRLKTRLENNCVKTQTNSQNLEEYQTPNTPTVRPLATQQIPTTAEPTNSSSNKRYSCTFCPYATDRRDLFTRHENIHREEKPFQCYVCQKQFNRADHVKKHFLRMHREHSYDLNRIRRHPPKNASGMSYYQKYNSTSSSAENPDIGVIDSINGALSIPNGFSNMRINSARPSSAADGKANLMKTSSLMKSGKKKGEKRFTCCYCSWSGVDNWCLKRHMNTHLKPFICGLCDYKAARSERLATHVLKVHNKRACGKCSFLADDPTQLAAHQQEHHPLDQRNNRTAANNVLRNTSFVNTSASTSSTSFSQTQVSLKSHELTAAAALLQHGNRLLQGDTKSWKSHVPKQHGAARLFSYMEASDGSEPDCDSRSADANRVSLSHRLQSDFPEAGDVGSSLEEEDGEEELPLFVCPTCGCEFEDDGSLETHQYSHRHNSTSPAKAEDTKENINPKHNYRCRICDVVFPNQSLVMTHMVIHSSLSGAVGDTKKSRKQIQPKKYLLEPEKANPRKMLTDKYLTKLLARKGFSCNKCRTVNITPYHRKGALALHQYWRHSQQKPFECEHCGMGFRHRYQVVLHSGREHVGRNPEKERIDLVPVKEPILSSVHAPDDSHCFFNTTLTTSVPDIGHASAANVHKLGMSFFDHSFLHANTSINSPMPIIIPTFPPT